MKERKMFEINQENRNDLRESMQASLVLVNNKFGVVNESFDLFVSESTYEQLLNLTFGDRQNFQYIESTVLESSVFDLMERVYSEKMESIVESFQDAADYLSVLTEQSWKDDALKHAKTSRDKIGKMKIKQGTPDLDLSDEPPDKPEKKSPTVSASEFKSKMHSSRIGDMDSPGHGQQFSAGAEKRRQDKRSMTMFQGEKDPRGLTGAKVVAGVAGVAALGTIGYYLYKKFRKSGMSANKAKAKASGIIKKKRMR